MDIVVIEFDGQIEDFPVLIQSLDGLIEEGARHVVIDLHTLPFINSAALGYLVSAQNSMSKIDGQIAVARLQPAIARIMQMTNLDILFPTFDTVDEAIAHFQGEEPRPVRRHAWR